MLSSAMKTSVTEKLIMLQYNSKSVTSMNNLGPVLKQWDAKLISDRGLAGTFIKGDEYAARVPPAEPVLVGAPDSLLNVMKIEEYKTEYKSMIKKNIDDRESRRAIFSDLVMATSEEAKAQMSTHDGYDAVILAGVDPLAYVRIAKVQLMITDGGGLGRARTNAKSNYLLLRQTESMKLCDYHEAVKEAISIMAAVGADISGDDEQVCTFIENSTHRFHHFMARKRSNRTRFLSYISPVL